MTEFSPFGKDLFGNSRESAEPLKSRFIIPPFSVWDTKAGDWQARKRMWISLGIKSEVGRGNVQGSLESARRAQLAAPGRSPLPAMDYSTGERGDGKGRSKTKARQHAALHDAKLKAMIGFNVGVDKKHINSKVTAIRTHFKHFENKENQIDGDAIEPWVVSSIFDPVVCELAYKWWCPLEGQVLDPFAGGSVRGIVAALLGRRYWGCDLRLEQIEANEEQRAIVNKYGGNGENIEWVCGDSLDTVENAPEADFLFSCPPYGNLEIYSEDPRDISNMSFKDFIKAYREIIRKSCQRLKPNRFACFVVGDFRNKDGHYCNFVPGTIKAFRDAGLEFYNDIVLVNVVGTASVRGTRQFRAGRKVVKLHQNVLVFVKGDWREAVKSLDQNL